MPTLLVHFKEDQCHLSYMCFRTDVASRSSNSHICSLPCQITMTTANYNHPSWKQYPVILPRPRSRQLPAFFVPDRQEIYFEVPSGFANAWRASMRRKQQEVRCVAGCGTLSP